MNKTLLKLIIPYSILFITILSIQPYTSLKFGSTSMWWVFEFFSLFLFWKFKEYFCAEQQQQSMGLIKLYLCYNIFSIIRGIVIADGYWEYKGLTTYGLALLLPVVAYAATNVQFVKKMLSVYIKYTLPLFLFFVFFISNGGKGFYLVPLSFLVLFFPVIKSPYKYLVVGGCLFVLFLDLAARSNVIKFGLPTLLSLLFYFKALQSVKLFELIRKGFMVLPFFLFFLAVSGLFNIFNMNGYVESDHVQVTVDADGKVEKEDLLSDTRTGLYVEVLQTAKKYNSWIIGRSPAKGNETKLFGSLSKITGSKERGGNEVAILNIFTWTGIVGVLFYFFIFYQASYLAINNSNNIFAKLLGVFIAFRWVFSWAEDINYFTLNTFILWMMIGLCFSKAFRAMKDKEVAFWVNSIFDKRYLINSKGSRSSMSR